MAKSSQEPEVNQTGEVAATVVFAWTGSRLFRRVIEPYVWEAANEFKQAVDLDTAAALLTYPIPGEFVPVAGQTFSDEVYQQLAEKMGGAVAEVKELLESRKTK